MSTEFITYEFKVKRTAEPWEKIEVAFTLAYAPDYEHGPSDFAQLTANRYGVSVRWNSKGSLQGNYAHPTTE